MSIPTLSIARIRSVDSLILVFPCAHRFLREHHLLCRWQDDLELACFIVCRKYAPEALTRHGWPCYQAAEMTELVAELTKITRTKRIRTQPPFSEMLDCQVDRFVCDLENARRIRNRAVHREFLTHEEMKKLEESKNRLLTTLECLIGEVPRPLNLPIEVKCGRPSVHCWNFHEECGLDDPRRKCVSVYDPIFRRGERTMVCPYEH